MGDNTYTSSFPTDGHGWTLIFAHALLVLASGVLTFGATDHTSLAMRLSVSICVNQWAIIIRVDGVVKKPFCNEKNAERFFLFCSKVFWKKQKGF